MSHSAASLIRLVYSSSLRVGITFEDLAEIVRVSDERNRRAGISGMLAVDGTRVCQILEGPPEAVITLYRMIEWDPRHQGVVELSRQPIAHRAFASWGMTVRSMAVAAMVAFAN